LALLGQFAVDILYGDAEIARDVLYGYKRTLAARLVQGWVGSLVWVVGFWLAILGLRRFVPRLWLPVVILAVLVVIAASVSRIAPIPLVFAWLLLAAVLLHALYRAARARLMED
jgi:hypothetical protein